MVWLAEPNTISHEDLWFFFFYNIAWNHYFSLRDNDKTLPLNWIAKKFNTLLSGQEWPMNILMYSQNFSLVTFSTKWPSSIKTEKSRQGSQDPLVSIFPFHEMLWLQLCILVFQNIFLLPEHPWKKSIRISWVSLYYLQFCCLSPMLTQSFSWKFSMVVQTHTLFPYRRQWHPTLVLLPGESQEWGSLVGCHLWGLTESDTTGVT